MNKEADCTGSCEARWTSRITTGFCILCCCSASLRMIPSEERPISPTGFIDVKPEEELAMGVAPWVAVGIPAAFADHDYDGHSCIVGNCRAGCKWAKDGMQNLGERCCATLLNCFCHMDKEE